MQINNDEWCSLELIDIIKINQLVRKYIDIVGFELWYKQLKPKEQSALTTSLYEFSHQAGFSKHMLQDSLLEADLRENDETVVKALSFCNKKFLDLDGFESWFHQLNKSDREKIFAMCVFLFGKSERSVFENENIEDCNHWWHRDILDEKVVQSILADPYYYKSSRNTKA